MACADIAGGFSHQKFFLRARRGSFLNDSAIPSTNFIDAIADGLWRQFQICDGRWISQKDFSPGRWAHSACRIFGIHQSISPHICHIWCYFFSPTAAHLKRTKMTFPTSSASEKISNDKWKVKLTLKSVTRPTATSQQPLWKEVFSLCCIFHGRLFPLSSCPRLDPWLLYALSV